MSKKPTIGFIGQGWIGASYADDFEARGYDVVRYALENGYEKNKEQIATCDIVFVAVPTPTTKDGFDDSIVRSVLPLIGRGNTVVIKSTLLPGTTDRLQAAFPDIYILHSPEFLREKTAKEDAAHPMRNIVGIPHDTKEYRAKAEQVIAVLPEASYVSVCSAREAELIKYIGNGFLFTKVLFMNIMYDLAQSINADWDTVREAVSADPRIGSSHMHPVHESGHGGTLGRGAGGHCFIKDFAALRSLYEACGGDEAGGALLRAMESKNIQLLQESGKDIDLLEDVYGKGV